MELMTKQGYKQTEVGLIPDDWEVTNIGSVSTIFGRIGFRGYTVNDIVKEDQGAITLSPSNIINGKLTLRKVTYLSWFKYEESPEIKIYNGDILLVKTGSTYGKTTLVTNLKRKATLNPQVVVLKKIKCNNAYLGFMMGFPIIQNQIESSVVGGAIPTLSQEQVYGFQIPIPPTLTEQKAIATALSDVDALIASLEQTITKKKAIKQGAMQQLLTPPHKGGKRLPGFSGEWVEKTLGEISKINMGQSPLSANYNNDGIGLPLVQGNADIKNRKTIIRNYTSQITKTADANDIIMSVRAPVGEVATTKFNCCIGRGVCSIKYPNGFLYHFLIYFEPSWAQFSTGSTFDSINSNQLKELEMSIPNTSEEQQGIAQILSDMDAEITQLETKKEKYQAIKKGMMQELLTGKTRLI